MDINLIHLASFILSFFYLCMHACIWKTEKQRQRDSKRLSSLYSLNVFNALGVWAGWIQVPGTHFCVQSGWQWPSHLSLDLLPATVLVLQKLEITGNWMGLLQRWWIILIKDTFIHVKVVRRWRETKGDPFSIQWSKHLNKTLLLFLDLEHGATLELEEPGPSAYMWYQHYSRQLCLLQHKTSTNIYCLSHL